MGYFGIPFRNGVPIGLGSVASFGAQQFDPSSLFIGGTAGAWYDPSDLSTLFTTSAGTTQCAMPGQGSAVSVGLMLDKSQGLVLGPELITNGDFSNGGTGWTQISNIFTFSGGRAIASNTDSIKRLSNTASSMVAGRWYKITWNQYAGSGTGAANWTIPGVWSGVDNFANGGSYINGEGEKTVYFLAPASGQFYLYNFEQSVEYDNISVRELPGNHAIAFNDTTARPELRARVNLLTYSEEFDNADWGKSNASILPNSAVAPNGTTTADTVSVSSNSNFVRQVFSTTVGVQKTLSVYAKANTSNVLRLGSGQWGLYANFNLTSGTVSSVSAGASAGIENAGSGWFRCFITAVDNTTLIGYEIVCPTAGDSIYIWGADLRPANIGANVPAYQRIADQYTYDSNGFPSYLRFDGVDDSMYTPASINFSGTDKMSVFAGVRRLTDTSGVICEFSANWNSNNGTMLFWGGSNTEGTGPAFNSASRGNAGANANQFGYSPTTFVPPVTAVVTATHDIPGDLSSVRGNGVVGTNGTGDKGAGNFGTYPLYIGSRGNSGLYFNGQIYSLIIAGSAVSAGNISATEQWVAQRTGIVIP